MGADEILASEDDFNRHVRFRHSNIPEIKDSGLRKEIEEKFQEVINAYSLENGSNTPDFILAEHLVDYLEILNKTLKKRSDWYGNKDSINGNSPSGVL